MIALELRDVVINQYRRAFADQYWFWTDRMGGRLLCVRGVERPVLSDGYWRTSLSLSESDDSLAAMYELRGTSPVFRFRDRDDKDQYERDCRDRLRGVLERLDIAQ